MTWQYPETAPTGVPLRAAVQRGGCKGTIELCYDLVKRPDGRWCYARTMAPVFPWHEPVLWSNEPRTPDEQKAFNEAALAAHGWAFRPSYDNRPMDVG